MTTAAPPRWRRGLVAAPPPNLAVLLALVLCWPAEEDAFIYFRFAVNAARGLGLVFNEGQRVEGYSSPIWMLLLAIAAHAPIAVHVLARALGVVWSALAVVAVGRLGRAAGLSPPDRLGAQLTLALSYWVLVWAQSGLETPLYMTLLALASAAYLRAEFPCGDAAATPRTRWIAGALLGIAALGRPEGAALGLLALADRVAVRRWRAAATYAVAAAVVFLPYVVWRRTYFGAWLPNTSVKLYPLHFDRSLPQAAGFVGYLGVVVLVLPAVWWLSKRGGAPDRARLGRLWLAGVVLAFGFHFLAGGDYRPGFRYVIAPLPLLLVAGWGSLGSLLAAAPRPSRSLARAAFALTLVVPSAVLWWHDPWRDMRPSGIARAWRDPMSGGAYGGDAGAWILQHVPDGSLVAYGQMGKAPYEVALAGSHIRFLDTVGWVDRDVAQIYRLDRKVGAFVRELRGGASPSAALTKVRNDRAAAFAALVLRRRPDVVLAERDLAHGGLERLLVTPEFQAEYEALPPLGGGAVRAFARRPSTVRP